MVRKKLLNKPLVSVNIRTYNSEKYLEETLKSVKNQSYKNIEILVSDGFSKDNSVKIAKSYGTRIGYADKLGDARHQNFIKSKGKYIFSLDSDQVLDKELIKTCVEKVEKNNLDALTISEKSFVNSKSTLIEKIIAYDKWLIDKNKDDNAMFGTACPRFFKKDFLKKVIWPPELSIFDDTILHSEIINKGAKCSYLSKHSIYHHEVNSWIIFAKKFFRYGKGYIKAFGQNPSAIAVHSLPRRSYFSPVALSKPYLFFGLMFLYLVKISSASLGAISYLINKK